MLEPDYPAGRRLRAGWDECARCENVWMVPQLVAIGNTHSTAQLFHERIGGSARPLVSVRY